jgi:hypothetical protein
MGRKYPTKFHNETARQRRRNVVISEDSALFGIMCVFLEFGQECGAFT